MDLSVLVLVLVVVLDFFLRPDARNRSGLSGGEALSLWDDLRAPRLPPKAEKEIEDKDDCGAAALQQKGGPPCRHRS